MEKIKTTTRQKNILVVDNDQNIVGEMSDYLNETADTQLNMVFVKSVKQAMRQMAEKNFELIIVEIILPVINGYLFLDYLKKNHPDQPVLIYTRLKGAQDLSRLGTYSVENIVLKQMTKVEPFMRWLDQAKSIKSDLSKRIIEIQNQFKSQAEQGANHSSKILQCSRCSMVLNRNSHFCNNCGQKVVRAASKPLQAESEAVDKNKLKKVDSKPENNTNATEGESKTKK